MIKKFRCETMFDIKSPEWLNELPRGAKINSVTVSPIPDGGMGCVVLDVAYDVPTAEGS